MKSLLVVVFVALALSGCGGSPEKRAEIDIEAACADPRVNDGDVAACKKNLRDVEEQINDMPEECIGVGGSSHEC